MQGEIEEVARAAGRVENAHVGEALKENVELCFGSVEDGLAGPAATSREYLGHFGLDRLPFDRERPHDDRLDDHHDLFRVGVVRADLRPLVGVEEPFKQGTEDRWVNRRPVLFRNGTENIKGIRIERQCFVVVEQPAIEMQNMFEAEFTAFAHVGEQFRQHFM